MESETLMEVEDRNPVATLQFSWCLVTHARKKMVILLQTEAMAKFKVFDRMIFVTHHLLASNLKSSDHLNTDLKDRKKFIVRLSLLEAEQCREP